MITLKELAKKVDGELIGDESINISSVDDIKSAVDFSNDYAPEHLIINVDVEEVRRPSLTFLPTAALHLH